MKSLRSYLLILITSLLAFFNAEYSISASPSDASQSQTSDVVISANSVDSKHSISRSSSSEDHLIFTTDLEEKEEETKKKALSTNDFFSEKVSFRHLLPNLFSSHSTFPQENVIPKSQSLRLHLFLRILQI